MSRAAIKRGAIADWCDEQLYKGALPFWLGHSVDFEVGGFFNNLDCDSCLTETTKHVWLQGRQCWTFAKVALEGTQDGLAATAKIVHEMTTASEFKKPSVGCPNVSILPLAPRTASECRAALLLSALKGCSFLAQRAIRRLDDEDDGGAPGRVYFALSRYGHVVGEQRKIFGACFVAMAFSEAARCLQGLLDPRHQLEPTIDSHRKESDSIEGASNPFEAPTGTMASASPSQQQSFVRALAASWASATGGIIEGLAGAGLLNASHHHAEASGTADYASAPVVVDSGRDEIAGTADAAAPAAEEPPPAYAIDPPEDWLQVHDALIEAAVALFQRVLAWSKDDAALGRPVHGTADATPSHASPLAVPMISLSVMLDFLGHRDVAPFSSVASREQRVELAAGILLHGINGSGGNGIVLECVCSDGGPDDSTAASRQFNPGHAIEAGWFLLDYVRRYPDEAGDVLAMESQMRHGSDPMPGKGRPPVPAKESMREASSEIKRRCLRTIGACFVAGWDGIIPAALEDMLLGSTGVSTSMASDDSLSSEMMGRVRGMVKNGAADVAARGSTGDGGILYFLDSRGMCPQALEWDMKLWWPHCEALVGFALADLEMGHGQERGGAKAEGGKEEEEKGKEHAAGQSDAGNDGTKGGVPGWLEALEMTQSWVDSHLVTTGSSNSASSALSAAGSSAGGSRRAGGEWLGYLSRDGRPTHSIVGGAYKGAFHVPRALLLAAQMLRAKR